MNKTLIFCLFLPLIGCVQSHLLNKQDIVTNVEFRKKQEVYQFEVLSSNDIKVKPTEGKVYTWFNAGEIHKSEGDYEGRLLHGSLKKLTIDGVLLEKSSFKHGIKDGKWQEWYLSGKTKSIYHWDDGDLDGGFIELDSLGMIVLQGTYKSGKLVDELLKRNPSGQLDTLTYENGIVVSDGPKQNREVKNRKIKQAVPLDSLNHQ